MMLFSLLSMILNRCNNSIGFVDCRLFQILQRDILQFLFNGLPIFGTIKTFLGICQILHKTKKKKPWILCLNLSLSLSLQLCECALSLPHYEDSLEISYKYKTNWMENPRKVGLRQTSAAVQMYKRFALEDLRKIRGINWIAI